MLNTNTRAPGVTSDYKRALIIITSDKMQLKNKIKRVLFFLTHSMNILLIET